MSRDSTRVRRCVCTPAGVLVLAATNRPDKLDGALLRPGRFDVLLYVPPPDEAGRLAALRVHTRGLDLDDTVSLPEIASATERFTGEELQYVCDEAAVHRDRKSVV